VERGEASRVEDGNKAYFGIPGTSFRNDTSIWVENEKLVNSPLPKPQPITFRESDYDASEKKDELTGMTVRLAQYRKHTRTRVVLAIVVAICVIAALVAGTIISDRIGARRAEEVTLLAQTEANRILQEALANDPDWVGENGVTEVTATVQEVIFVSQKYLLYSYQEPHYLVKLRIDCTATDVQFGDPQFLASDVTDEMPNSFGEVDGFWVYLRSESIKDSDKLYGGQPYELTDMLMTYVYVNGEFVQGPRFR
jgi:hypothetical protein